MSKEITMKVFGVGRAGIKLVEQSFGEHAAWCVAVDTDDDVLAGSTAAAKVHVETRLLRGLGSGGDPERARKLGEEHLPKFKTLCEGVEVVFIMTGLGGGAGTGVSPVVARAARESGALALGFVTMPFECEGRLRAKLAVEGLVEMKEAADGVICLPNQKIFKLIDENKGVIETLEMGRQLLGEAGSAIWRLLVKPSLIEVHFNEVCDLIRGKHAESAFAVAEGMGPTRSAEVSEKLLAHPMLDGGEVLEEAEAMLVSVMGGPDLTMAEVNRVMEPINSRCGQAQLRMGATIDETLGDRLVVTLIAAKKQAAADNSRKASAEELETQLLSEEEVARHGSRFVPPAPAELPAEKMEQILARQRGSGRRVRKVVSKFQQGQLPLEIVSKGRFDRSEPTIHKGEDLDVPTYVRRGVALN